MNIPTFAALKTLTPARAVAVYALTLLLMLFLDAGRLSSLLDRMDVAPAAAAGQVIKQIADASGLSALSRTERELVERATVERTLGASPRSFATPPAPPVLEATSNAPLPATPQALLPESPLPPAPQTPLLAVPAGKPKVLLIGDSLMMEGFGPVLQRTLRKRPDMEVIREGRYSTGLSRADYFDWPTTLQGLIDSYAPDLVVICMGANDPQDIIDENNKRHHADSDSWRTLYQTRAERLLEIATAKGSKVVWMGLPIMSKEPYSTRVRRLSDLQKAACAKNDAALFVDSTAVLSDGKGAYTTFTTDAKGKHVRLRYKDMVHVTEDGGRLLTANLVPYIEQALRLGGTVAPAPSPAETVATTQTPPSVPQPPQSGIPASPASAVTAVTPVATVASVAAVVPLPTTTPAVTPRQPQVRHLRSVLRGKDVAYLAYLPATSGARDERFPVLYLLHGAYESAEVWPKRTGTLLQELADKHRIVLVAPSCEPFGWYADSPRIPTSRIESFILTELLPQVEKNLPVLQRRGVAGISMGGHGAFILGLRHPGVFTSLSAMSGVLDITRHQNQWKIKDVLGTLSANRTLWNTYSAQHLLRTVSPANAPAMLVTAGANDSLILQENRVFRDTLRKGGFIYQYRETPGGHDWLYWNAELPQHVAFHAAHLRR